MSKHIMCNECEMCDGDRCTYFDNDSDRESTLACILFEPKNPTLFDRITASPEVLAGRFVYKILSMGVNRRSYIWWKSSIIPDVDFTNREEALAATVEKLKEVEK